MRLPHTKLEFLSFFYEFDKNKLRSMEKREHETGGKKLIIFSGEFRDSVATNVSDFLGREHREIQFPSGWLSRRIAVRNRTISTALYVAPTTSLSNTMPRRPVRVNLRPHITPHTCTETTTDKEKQLRWQLISHCALFRDLCDYCITFHPFRVHL